MTSLLIACQRSPFRVCAYSGFVIGRSHLWGSRPKSELLAGLSPFCSKISNLRGDQTRRSGDQSPLFAFDSREAADRRCKMPGEVAMRWVEWREERVEAGHARHSGSFPRLNGVLIGVH